MFPACVGRGGGASSQSVLDSGVWDTQAGTKRRTGKDDRRVHRPRHTPNQSGGGEGCWMLTLAGVIILPALSFWALNRVVSRDLSKTVVHKLKDIPNNYVRPGRNNLWVAVFMGRIIGCVAVEEVTRARDVAILRSMSVDSSYQGLGVGKRLLEVVLAFCEEHGYGEIKLGTTEFQKAAQGLYERFGFKQTGRVAVPLPLGKRLQIWNYRLILPRTARI
ncbi:N acetyltransferase [Klebsormidium nitens]|uniref:N acetyltransferase n=1 Tax=Klebsormidium nitens TaxID=105231 RepID=A0A1Y1HQ84_KLENI|nr:N acetyltransferase [Klebsormidium nitens]|eukprot:GAQ79952.1 N acetyltransferase [Klebsormidium nitens]